MTNRHLAFVPVDAMVEVSTKGLRTVARLPTANRQLYQPIVQFQQQVRVGAVTNVLQLMGIFLKVIHLNVALNTSSVRTDI